MILIYFILNLYVPRPLNLQRTTTFQMINLNILNFVKWLIMKIQFIIHAYYEIVFEFALEIIRGMYVITSLILNIIPFKNVFRYSFLYYCQNWVIVSKRMR